MQDLILYFEYFWIAILIAVAIGLVIPSFLFGVIYRIALGIGVIYTGGGILEAGVIIGVSLIIQAIYNSIHEKRKKSKQNSDSPFCVEILDHKKKKVVIEDVNRGVSIFAASGGGKSAGPIYWLSKHFAKYKFAGIVNDYKNYELTEVIYPIFKEQGIDLKIWAVHDPNRSVQVNPIAPRYIKVESDLIQITNSLMLNLYPSNGGESQFFVDAAASVLNGVIWRLKEDFPENCNLPFVIALLMSYKALHRVTQTNKGEVIEPFGKLIDFITASPRAQVLANMFLLGISNERQTGSVMSELASGLCKLASPEVFYLLGTDGFDLAINSEENRCVLSVVNNPRNAMFISPINAMIMECCFVQMSERDRDPAFVLLDEARSIKLAELGQKVCTLRSFNVSFVYCLQDKIQGQVQNSGKDYILKEILSNLSVQFFGKVNDPDTAKYYEKYFEMIKEEQKSFSKGDGGFFSSPSESRTNTSFKDVSLFKSSEFFKFIPGEFVMFSGGIAQRFRFFYTPPKKELPIPVRQITSLELDMMYTELLGKANDFLNAIS